MGRMIYYIALALSVMTSCSTSNSHYEKAIADFVQTDRKGVWTDLQFKALETTVSNVTVADSIQILKNEFEESHRKNIEALEQSVAGWKESISECSGDFVGRALRAGYEKRLAETTSELERIKKDIFEAPTPYVDRLPNDVLCQKVVCRYSMVPPTFNNGSQERTDTFIFSADGSTCLRKLRR